MLAYTGGSGENDGFLFVCNKDVFGPLELGADTVMGMAVNSITSRGFGVLQDKVDKSPRLLGGGAKEFL